MHASPAFHVIVRRYGIWRAVVIALVAMTAAVLIAWLVSRDEFTPLALRASVAVVGVGLIIAAAQLTRLDAMSLRWDTQCWHLGPASTAGDEPSTGQLVVAIDLGGWMLLRFDDAAAASSARKRTRWLPVQRRGLEREWHALRCAVYCARPVSGNDAGLNPAVEQDSKNERP